MDLSKKWGLEIEVLVFGHGGFNEMEWVAMTATSDAGGLDRWRRVLLRKADIDGVLHQSTAVSAQLDDSTVSKQDLIRMIVYDTQPLSLNDGRSTDNF